MDQAIAFYDETVANYRETVLTGFQQVEDNVAALRILEHEAQVQEKQSSQPRNTWNSPTHATWVASRVIWK